MRAIDTNVLVCLVTRDDPARTQAAERFVRGGAWVSVVALVEAVWVLGSIYELKPAGQAKVVAMLLDHRELVLQESGAVSAALDLFRRKPTLGFSDCLIAELGRQAGHGPTGTFDKGLAKVEGAERL